MPGGSTAGHDQVNLDRGLMRTRLRATRPLDQVCNCCLLVKRRAETVPPSAAGSRAVTTCRTSASA
jgi:hypothetical protein